MTSKIAASLRGGLAALTIGATLAGTAWADVSPGSYLAALAARDANDFGKAAEFYARALLADPGNSELMEETIRAYVGLGRFDRALPVAERIADAGIASQVGAIVRIEDMAASGEWDTLISNNPFPKAVSDPKSVHAAWLSDEPDQANIEAVRSFALEGEHFEVIGNVAYLHTPHGFGRSKMAEMFDKRIGVPNTARNWRTVLALQDLAAKAAG